MDLENEKDQDKKEPVQEDEGEDPFLLPPLPSDHPKTSVPVSKGCFDG